MYNNIAIFPPQAPGLKNSTLTLNKKTSLQPFAVDYVKTQDGHYTSLDPRIYDSPRDQRLELDSPPLQVMGTQPQGDIYKMEGNKTGFYKDYQSINGGNIKYYNDLFSDLPGKSASLISLPIYSIPEFRFDPMGNPRPEYTRIPINTKKNAYSEYSHLCDTSEFREDIIWQRNIKPRYRARGIYNFFENREQNYPMYHYPVEGHFPWTSKDFLKNNNI